MLYVADYVPPSLVVGLKSHSLHWFLTQQPSWFRDAIALGCLLLGVALLVLTQKEDRNPRRRRYFLLVGLGAIQLPVLSIIHFFTLVIVSNILAPDAVLSVYGRYGPWQLRIILIIAPAIFLYGAIGLIVDMFKSGNRRNIKSTSDELVITE